MAINTFPLDGLMSSDIYSINRSLREGRSLEGGCGAYLDYQGWTSMRAFIRAVDLMFYDLWRCGALGAFKGYTAYRGITVTEAFLSVATRDRCIQDAGYSFGSSDVEEAIYHAGKGMPSLKGVYEREGEGALVPVLLEIETGKNCLYIPRSDEPDPYGFRSEFMTGGLGEGQYVFERHSLLRVKSVEDRRGLVSLRAVQVM